MLEDVARELVFQSLLSDARALYQESFRLRQDEGAKFCSSVSKGEDFGLKAIASQI